MRVNIPLKKLVQFGSLGDSYGTLISSSRFNGPVTVRLH